MNCTSKHATKSVSHTYGMLCWLYFIISHFFSVSFQVLKSTYRHLGLLFTWLFYIVLHAIILNWFRAVILI
jgi:hypothetical protein